MEMHGMSNYMEGTFELSESENIYDIRIQVNTFLL